MSVVIPNKLNRFCTHIANTLNMKRSTQSELPTLPQHLISIPGFMWTKDKP